jgi:fumarate reductase subunit D
MKKIIIAGLALLTPFMAMAADLTSILSTIRTLANTIIPLFMVIAVAVFLWGIIKYITSAGDEEKRKGAHSLIIYGLIGIFVMVAFWGIITVVTNTFGIQQGGTVPLPTVNP